MLKKLGRGTGSIEAKFGAAAALNPIGNPVDAGPIFTSGLFSPSSYSCTPLPPLRRYRSCRMTSTLAVGLGVATAAFLVR